jgi:hypothetical protein
LFPGNFFIFFVFFFFFFSWLLGEGLARFFFFLLFLFFLGISIQSGTFSIIFQAVHFRET